MPFIDWTFFFSAWELKGRFPGDPRPPELGGPARELYDNAQVVLTRIIREKRLTARGVYGFWPANTIGDDIVVYQDDARRAEVARFHMLRQQEPIADGRPNRSLADFVAPKDSLAPDYIGAFAVTAGIGADELAREYEKAHDDYNAIITKALADRLAEAFAEYLHAQARKDWGYGKDEALSNDALIAEKYRGIRPAFGYPACPDHSEKPTLFESARRASGRDHADRVVRDDAGGLGERPVPEPPAGQVLQRRPHRPRSDRGLRRAQGRSPSSRPNAGLGSQGDGALFHRNGQKRDRASAA